MLLVVLVYAFGSLFPSLPLWFLVPGKGFLVCFSPGMVFSVPTGKKNTILEIRNTQSNEINTMKNDGLTDKLEVASFIHRGVIYVKCLRITMVSHSESAL